jgi:hypothetical protein
MRKNGKHYLVLMSEFMSVILFRGILATINSFMIYVYKNGDIH